MTGHITFRCPVCHGALDRGPNVYVCVNNHSFDIAKQGYVNLLLAHQKNSKHPGDSLQMMRSRQRFLNSGRYQALAEALSISVRHASTLLDVGCGEGYYLQEMLRESDVTAAGIDISKHAVRLAAQRKLLATLAVGNAFGLPFQDSTFDMVTSVFSPIDPNETARVTRVGGVVIMAGPGPAHLQSLAECVYAKAVPHSGNYQTLAKDSRFELLDEKEIRITSRLRNDELEDLISMTPYGWHASQEQRSKLLEKPVFETEFHFIIQQYRRR